jgi:hypothetical protein
LLVELAFIVKKIACKIAVITLFKIDGLASPNFKLSVFLLKRKRKSHFISIK